MSIDTWLHVVVIAALLVATLFFARDLWTGRFRFDGKVWRRDERPGDYWPHMAANGLTLLLVAAGLILLAVADWRDPNPPYGSVIVLAVLAPRIGHVLWTGYIPFGNDGLGYRRADRPGAYWSFTLAGAAICALTVALLADELSE